QLPKLLEQVAAVMRPRRRLGVILHAEHGQFAVPHPLQRAVVQVDVRRLHVCGQRPGVYRETVVLRRDLHAAAAVVDDRLIRPAVAELQLERLAAQRQAKQLMTETDAEQRLFPDELADGADGVAERLW